MSADRPEKVEEPSREQKSAGRPSRRKFSWGLVVLEVALALTSGVVSGALVSWWSISEQARLDDQRSDREQRVENLRFVRERSVFEEDSVYEGRVVRPFSGMDLEGQNLSGLQLRGADFREANLYKAALRGAALGNAQLGGADLREADMEGLRLEETSLQGVNLAGSNLKFATIREVSLYEADLTGVDLSNANLIGVTFTRAQLKGANLTGATLADADYGGLDTYGEKGFTVCYDETTVWPDGFDPPPRDDKSCLTR